MAQRRLSRSTSRPSLRTRKRCVIRQFRYLLPLTVCAHRYIKIRLPRQYVFQLLRVQGVTHISLIWSIRKRHVKQKTQVRDIVLRRIVMLTIAQDRVRSNPRRRKARNCHKSYKMYECTTHARRECEMGSIPGTDGIGTGDGTKIDYILCHSLMDHNENQHFLINYHKLRWLSYKYRITSRTQTEWKTHVCDRLIAIEINKNLNNAW
jgi:hypothetical protein